MKIKAFCILTLIFVCFGCFFANNFGDVSVYAENSAKSMIVIEANSNRVLMASNENELRANASTTKIATFLTVLKHCDNFDERFKIDDRAVGISGTSIYLKKGEMLTVRELLYGMMLVSGNDAATALALHISDSVEHFAELMTQEAKNCGALNTTFKNPHGLDENGHKTTAYDLAQITRECYKYPIFEEIVTTKNAKIPDSTGNGYRYLKNKNKLLWSLDGCNGVKTGFTDDAGRCLVSSAERNGMHLICVVLSCGPMFEESALHLQDCFAKYHMSKILLPYTYLRKINVEDSDTTEVKVYTQRGFSYPLTDEEESRIKTEIDVIESVKAPVKKEQIVGEFKIYLDNHLLFSEKIYTMEDVKSNKVTDNFKKIISKW